MIERIDTCMRHFEASLKWKGEKTGIFEMRRHYASYFKGIPNFKEYRIRLVEASASHQVFDIFHELKEKSAEEVFV